MIPVRIAHEPDLWDDDDEGLPEPAVRLARLRQALKAHPIPPIPEPTAEEIADAQRKVDAGMRRLIFAVLSEDELRVVNRGHRQFQREQGRV